MFERQLSMLVLVRSLHDQIVRSAFYKDASLPQKQPQGVIPWQLHKVVLGIRRQSRERCRVAAVRDEPEIVDPQLIQDECAVRCEDYLTICAIVGDVIDEFVQVRVRKMILRLLDKQNL